MNQIHLIYLPLLRALAAAILLLGGGAWAAPSAKPNIVILFIDDMGYGDIGPFGNTVNQTPHLDRMAEEGMVLTDFYVANTACTPSRAALLTGTYAHRIGMDGGKLKVTFPGDSRGLNPNEITLAEMLGENGYATGCFGKWHLGDQPQFMPLAQGFDTYFGIPYSNDMWPLHTRKNPITKRKYEPLPVMRQDKAVAHVADGVDQSLLAEVITDEAIAFIKKNQKKPFFCYIPHAHVHKPRHARPEYLKRAEGNVNRAHVEEVDDSVGRVLQTLKDLKLHQNTLVIFTSDNGPASGMSSGPLRGMKGGKKYEGHMRVPTLAWWPDTIPAGRISKEIGVTTDLLPTLATLTQSQVPTDRIIDGKDISDILLGKKYAQSPRQLHYYENEGIRKGDWKLVKKGSRSELYDLSKDLGEKKDLSGSHPELVKELDRALQKHASNIAANLRPAGFAKHPKPILREVGDLPTLKQYLGK
ncbi:MAG: sulfatase [Pseudomonadales bacterium]|jgi:arylsulfatase A